MSEDSISAEGYCSFDLSFSNQLTVAVTFTDGSATSVTFADVAGFNVDFTDKEC